MHYVDDLMDRSCDLGMESLQASSMLMAMPKKSAGFGGMFGAKSKSRAMKNKSAAPVK